MEDIIKQVKVLKIYALVLTFFFIALIITVIFFMNTGRFKEITTERINIIEPDGSLRMVLSNQKKQTPGMINGKSVSMRDRPAGIIFFNEDGDEDGGIVYDGNKKGASMTYSFDQYKNDQLMQLQYSQVNNATVGNTRSYGLKLWDRPDDFTLRKILAYSDSLKKLNDTSDYRAGINQLKETGKLGNERFFAGKNSAGEVGLFLRDSKGLLRIKICIDKNNQSIIQILNNKGKVISGK